VRAASTPHILAKWKAHSTKQALPSESAFPKRAKPPHITPFGFATSRNLPSFFFLPHTEYPKTKKSKKISINCPPVRACAKESDSAAKRDDPRQRNPPVPPWTLLFRPSATQTTAIMSSSLARPMLRSPALRQLAFRRSESTAANKASETAKDAAAKAKEYQTKAAQGLSRVAGAAGPAIAGAARGVTNALGKVGGRTGKLINFVYFLLLRPPPPPPPLIGFRLHWLLTRERQLCRANSSGRLLRQGRP
jgi:hypothetical protein